MTRTLITGASGFTARYLAPLLSARGHQVFGVSHVHEFSDIPGLHRMYEADLADLKQIRPIIDEIAPHHVVHLAAISFVPHSDVEQIYRTNVLGARQLLEALSLLREAPRSVLLASSANVYGNAREGVLDEAVEPAPANDYGVSKIAMEYAAALYCERLPVIVVRPFNYTGRGQSAEFIIPKIVEHARGSAKVIELGNLNVARDISDVRRVVEGYARLLSTPAAIGGTYNVCSGHAVTLNEVLELVWQLSGHRFDVRVNPALVRANEVRTLCGSVAKLEGVIGPLPSIPLKETLRWMLEAPPKC